MHYSLGIDAGGTYTDAVIIRDSDGEIVDSNKALTTYPDPLAGIKKVIDGLNKEYLENIKLVSVSTTLSTNTILEGNGFPVALILIGDHPLEKELPTGHVLFARGGHNHNGEEVSSLDLESIEKFALNVKDKVSAFAISSYFSTRNPEHELKVRDSILKLTGLPAVCGHELSQQLGAYERAITAFLNAQLIPITRQFVKSIIADMTERGINARLLMLKCDGSVIGIRDALQKPIETIFSGPAASLVGASYLSGLQTCAVVDVGGQVRISPQSAWESLTSAMKGQLWAAGRQGPGNQDGNNSYRRRQPCLDRGQGALPRAATSYTSRGSCSPVSGFLNNLKRTPMPAREDLGENIQPTKFFVRSGYNAGELSKAETEVLEVIGDEPVSVHEIKALIRKDLHPQTLDSLIKKRLVQAIGFTPTDALHVLDEYTAWNEEASRIGAERLASSCE